MAAKTAKKKEKAAASLHKCLGFTENLFCCRTLWILVTGQCGVRIIDFGMMNACVYMLVFISWAGQTRACLSISDKCYAARTLWIQPTQVNL